MMKALKISADNLDIIKARLSTFGVEDYFEDDEYTIGSYVVLEGVFRPMLVAADKFALSLEFVGTESPTLFREVRVKP